MVPFVELRANRSNMDMLADMLPCAKRVYVGGTVQAFFFCNNLTVLSFASIIRFM